MTRYIFVTGGVLSALGKGIAAASIGRLRLSSIVQSMTWTFGAGWVRRGACREY